jgi:hypothetical protein
VLAVEQPALAHVFDPCHLPAIALIGPSRRHVLGHPSALVAILGITVVRVEAP